MKKQNPLAGLTLLFAVLLSLGTARAQGPGKFDLSDSLGQDSILMPTDGAAQQNQAPAPYAPQSPPQVQYKVIELGGRRANDISQSGQIVGDTEFEPGIKATFWPSSQSAPIDLGSLPGLRSVATAINPGREMVGYAFNEDSSVERPLLWASTNSAPVEPPGLVRHMIVLTIENGWTVGFGPCGKAHSMCGDAELRFCDCRSEVPF